MPLVEFQTPLSKFSGKVGKAGDGQVYYVLDDRGVSRNLVVPANPNTAAQQTVRTIRSSLSVNYQSLTRPQAEAWNDFAKNFQKADVFGRKYSYRGVQAYQAVNFHRAVVGEAILSDPPSFTTTPAPMSIAFATVIDASILGISVQHLQAAASGYWRVRITRAMPGTARVARTNELRYPTENFADSYFAIDASPQDISFTHRFSFTAGDIIGIEIQGLSNDYVPGRVLFDDYVELGA